MSAKAATCPSREQLAEFGLGKLNPAASETLNQHLETCTDCRQIVARLAGDSFFERLRAAGTPEEGSGKGETQSGAAMTPEPSDSRSKIGFDSLSGGAAGRERKAKPANSTIPPASAPQELVDHPDYELIRELGHGGMGVVYLARNRMMDRLEVLKVVGKSLLDRPGALERFHQEIRAAARLAHPNIVAAYSVIRPGDLLVFCMEYVEGQDLAETVQQRGPLPVVNASYYIHQVALGLQHAHEKGMVHRDIKPGNLMLAVENKKHVVKILDFGLAKATSEKASDAGLTKSGQMLGTPDYIAPEQTLDAQKADIRADIYSLGCTLYYLLSGSAPFSGASLYEILHAHHAVESRPLNLVRPEVPRELATVVGRMMAKDPANRFQTPLEVAKALNPFFKAGGQPAKIDQSLPPQAAPSAPSAMQPLLPGQSGPIPVPMARAVPIAVSTAQPAAASPPGVTELDSLTSSAHSKSVEKPKTGSGGSGRGPRTPLLFGAAGLAGLLLLAAVMFKVRTRDGVLALEVNEPNAEVTIDGERITVAWADGSKQAEIRVAPGSHKIELKKDGFKATGETVEIECAGRRVLAATFEPLSSGEKSSKHEMAGASVGRPATLDATTAASKTAGLASTARQEIRHEKSTSKSSPDTDGFVSMFNGRDLSGWKTHSGQPGYWIVRDGAMLGRGSSLSHIYSERGDFHDIHVRMRARLPAQSGGGIIVRSSFGSGEHPPWPDGYEGQIEFVAGTSIGQAYSRPLSNTGSILVGGKPLTRASEAGVIPDEWFTMEIIAVDNQVTVLIGGDLVSSYTDPSRRFMSGHIALQCDFSSIIEVRTIEVKELQPPPSITSSPPNAAKPPAEAQESVVSATSGAKDAYQWPPRMPQPAIAPFDARQARAHQQAWAKHLRVPVEQTNSIGMQLVLIPPGEFMMGSTPDQNAAARAMAANAGIEFDSWQKQMLQADGPQHRVVLTNPFRLSVAEVTMGQFKQFVDATAYRTDAETSGRGTETWRTPHRFPPSVNSPVVCVTWSDAVAFCNWLSQRNGLPARYLRKTDQSWELLSNGEGYRLPTEAEWECACRGGTNTQYSFGDDPAVLPLHGWFEGNSPGCASGVCQKLPNPFGLYDMHGNVWEWCQDWYGGRYDDAVLTINPASKPAGQRRVMRGGVWDNHFVLCRSAYRDHLAPVTLRTTVGFRVASSVKMARQSRPDTDQGKTAPAAAARPGVSRPQAPVLFKQIDTDADGRLSGEEWVGKRTGDKASKAVSRFLKLDRDRDGFLTPEEFAGGVSDPSKSKN